MTTGREPCERVACVRAGYASCDRVSNCDSRSDGSVCRCSFVPLYSLLVPTRRISGCLPLTAGRLSPGCFSSRVKVRSGCWVVLVPHVAAGGRRPGKCLPPAEHRCWYRGGVGWRVPPGLSGGGLFDVLLGEERQSERRRRQLGDFFEASRFVKSSLKSTFQKQWLWFTAAAQPRGGRQVLQLLE